MSEGENINNQEYISRIWTRLTWFNLLVVVVEAIQLIREIVGEGVGYAICHPKFFCFLKHCFLMIFGSKKSCLTKRLGFTRCFLLVHFTLHKS